VPHTSSSTPAATPGAGVALNSAIRTWQVMHVLAWLPSVDEDLDKYKAKFKENEIDGARLLV
jgi:hypothetical protein